jgi:hypothetical protein
MQSGMGSGGFHVGVGEDEMEVSWWLQADHCLARNASFKALSVKFESGFYPPVRHRWLVGSIAAAPLQARQGDDTSE